MSYFQYPASGFPTAEALFLPAIQPGFASAIQNTTGTMSRAGLDIADLNYLSPTSKLLRAPAVLYSAGLASPTATCAVKARDKLNSLVVGDSGGFQIISGNVPNPAQVQAFLETHCDWSMTLDAPIIATLEVPNLFPTFRACLNWSLNNLQQFDANKQGKTKYLTVLQMPNPRQTRVWFDAVMKYDFWDGVAFAGPHNRNLALVLELLLKMHREGRLSKVRWVHFLGVSELEVSCALSVLQDVLRAEVSPELTVSFDASNASQQMSYGRIYSGYKLSNAGFSMSDVKYPEKKIWVGSNLPFPWQQTTIGRQLTLGALNVNALPGKTEFYDSFSHHMITHHNTEMLMRGIAEAQRIARLNQDVWVPKKIVQAAKLLRLAFQPGGQAVICNNKEILDFRLSNSEVPDDKS
jgi:hypothetical protein